MIKKERLDKILSNMGYGSRKDVKSIIKEGRVSVNNKITKENDLKINPYENLITIDGINLEYREYIYLMLNKPKDVVSSTDDPLNKTVLDLIDEDAIKFISEYIQKPYKKYDPKNYNQNSTSSLNINKENRKPIYRIIINNPILIEEVKRYHIIKNKTYNLSGFIIMENERKYIPYLVRGLIDGDGWVRKDGKEFYICSVSLKFIEWVKYCLENYLYMQDINISNRQIEGCKNIFCARTALCKNIAILKDIIYDEPYGMQRKYLNVHTNNT